MLKKHEKDRIIRKKPKEGESLLVRYVNGRGTSWVFVKDLDPFFELDVHPGDPVWIKDENGKAKKMDVFFINGR